MEGSTFKGFLGCFSTKKNDAWLKKACLPSADSVDVGEVRDVILSLRLFGAGSSLNLGCGEHFIVVNGYKIVFCGEVYNLKELCLELGIPKVSGNGDSISYIIGIMFQKYGVEFASKINGMFSIVIWNPDNKSLYLYVDRYGAAFPIFYRDHGELIFGSQLKFLLNCKDVSREVDLTGLALFLKYSYIPSPRTIVSGIKKLGPGEVLIYKNDTVKVYRYHSFEPLESTNCEELECIEKYVDLLGSSIESKMQGFECERVGFFLSGGLDSSASVALASRIGNSSFKTFGVGFEQTKLDERPYARLVADHFGVNFFDYVFNGSEIEYLPEIVWALDEPFMENGLFLTYAGFKLASNSVDLIIAGGATDQLFGTGGFAAGRPIALRYLLDKVHCRSVVDKLRRLVFQPPYIDNQYFKLKVMVDRAVDFNDWFFWGFDDAELQKLCKFSIDKQGVHCFSNTISDQSVTFDDYCQYALIHQDVEHYACQNVMVKSFRMADLFGIKLREPYLDGMVVDYILSLNRNLKTQGGIIDFLKGQRVSKYLHRAAMRKILPEKILNKPKQGGFVPMALLLANEKKRKKIYKFLLHSSALHEFFEMKEVQEVINACELSLSRKAYWFAFQDNKINQLMNLLVFSIWHQMHLVDHVSSRPEFTLSQMISD